MNGCDEARPSRRTPSEVPAHTQKQTARISPDHWLVPLPVQSYFPRRQPLEIDLGCGKGRFLLARAQAHPAVNFLGIDRMLRRIRKVDRKIVRRGLPNVRLLRVEAYYATLYLIPAAAVRCYYIFFPDPWPKSRHHKHRLFNPPFLDALDRTLVPGGQVHVATDHQPYFEEIAHILTSDERFTTTIPVSLPEEQRTDFELIFRGKTEIHRCAVEKKTGRPGPP